MFYGEKVVILPKCYIYKCYKIITSCVYVYHNKNKWGQVSVLYASAISHTVKTRAHKCTHTYREQEREREIILLIILYYSILLDNIM